MWHFYGPVSQVFTLFDSFLMDRAEVTTRLLHVQHSTSIKFCTVKYNVNIQIQLSFAKSCLLSEANSLLSNVWNWFHPMLCKWYMFYQASPLFSHTLKRIREHGCEAKLRLCDNNSYYFMMILWIAVLQVWENQLQNVTFNLVCTHECGMSVKSHYAPQCNSLYVLCI